LDQDLSPPIGEVGENGKSTTSGPIFSLQKNYFAPASTAADNHGSQRDTEKLISPYLKTSEKIKLPI
jgi:hypothetical protein